ncbi:histidinol-phosphatase HisJ [bacterium]|nr:histidinol-phosphatase HisJ [bacterium]
MRPVDLHVHTPYCGHATGSAEQTVQHAIKRHFLILGFSEHFPYPVGYVDPIPDCVVPHALWPDYVAEIFALQNAYPDLDIRLGAEVDYLPDYEKEIKKALSVGHYDYIYGSIHLLNDIGIDYSDKYLSIHLDRFNDADGLWDRYWENMEKLIRLEMCDILAHLDLPKKLVTAKPGRDQTEAVRHILSLVREYDLVIEINTGGIDRTYNHDPYPSPQILQIASEMGIQVTLGSDAHAPDQIGRYFDRAVELLQAFGWEKIVVFQDRKKEYLGLYEL